MKKSNKLFLLMALMFFVFQSCSKDKGSVLQSRGTMDPDGVQLNTNAPDGHGSAMDPNGQGITSNAKDNTIEGEGPRIDPLGINSITPTPQRGFSIDPNGEQQ